MMLALISAAQSPQPAGLNAAEERAVVASMLCLKRQVDAVPRRERLYRGRTRAADVQGYLTYKCLKKQGCLPVS